MKTSTMWFLTLLMAGSFSFSSCNPAKKEEKGELKYFVAKEEDFQTYINSKPMPAFPNLKSDKTLLNRDYPIEIALYNDGQWYYDLPNLDTGKGTWKLENGMIKLFAKQRLFDMHIDIVAIEESAKDVVIKFRDRFGPRILNTEKINIAP